MEALRKVANQTLWQLLGKAVTSISTIIILSLVSRFYGEYSTGVFTLALTYLSFFVLAVDFGVNAYVLQRFDSRNLEVEWQSLFGFRLLLGGLLTIISLLGILLWPSQELLFRQIVYVGSLFAIFSAAIFITVNAYFQYRLKYNLSTLAWASGSIITLLAALLLTFRGADLYSLIYGYSLGWIVTAVVALILLKRYFKSVSPLFDLKYTKQLLTHSWPISATLLINVFYFRIDSFLLSFFKTFIEVGVYNLAFQVFQAVLVLPTFIMNGYYPLMIESIKKDKKLFFSQLKKAILIMFLFSVAVSLTGILFSGLIINVLSGGNGFAASPTLLKILFLGVPAFFISSLLMWALITLKCYKQVLVVYLIGLIINFGLNYYFIPKYSYFASAVVTGLSEYVILILLFIVLKKNLND